MTADLNNGRCAAEIAVKVVNSLSYEAFFAKVNVNVKIFKMSFQRPGLTQS